MIFKYGGDFVLLFVIMESPNESKVASGLIAMSFVILLSSSGRREVVSWHEVGWCRMQLPTRRHRQLSTFIVLAKDLLLASEAMLCYCYEV